MDGTWCKLCFVPYLLRYQRVQNINLVLLLGLQFVVQQIKVVSDAGGVPSQG